MIRWILLLTLISLKLSAQEFSPAPFLGAGKTALAQKGIYSLSANTSGIAQLRRTEVAVSYQQHFVKTDIASQAILLGIPLKSQGAIGLSLTNYRSEEHTSELQSREN